MSRRRGRPVHFVGYRSISASTGYMFSKSSGDIINNSIPVKADVDLATSGFYVSRAGMSRRRGRMADGSRLAADGVRFTDFGSWATASFDGREASAPVWHWRWLCGRSLAETPDGPGGLPGGLGGGGLGGSPGGLGVASPVGPPRGPAQGLPLALGGGRGERRVEVRGIGPGGGLPRGPGEDGGERRGEDRGIGLGGGIPQGLGEGGGGGIPHDPWTGNA
jgi:hypothetical protein